MKKWIRRITDFVNDTQDEHMNAFAGQSAFFVFLSIFPLLNILLMLTPFLPYSQDELVRLITDVVPQELAGFVKGIISDIFANNSPSLTIISIVAGLWSAAKGIEAIRNGLNEVYRSRQKQNFMLLRAVSVLYTIIFIIIVLVLAFVNLFGDQVAEYISEHYSETAHIMNFIVRIRGVATFILAFGAILLMYTILPRRKLLFRFQVVGAACCSAAWGLITWGFSYYIRYTMNKSAMYGSLTTIILLMFWIYIMINVFLWCAQINEFLYIYVYKEREAAARARQKQRRKAVKEWLKSHIPFLKKIKSSGADESEPEEEGEPAEGEEVTEKPAREEMTEKPAQEEMMEKRAKEEVTENQALEEMTENQALEVVTEAREETAENQAKKPEKPAERR